MDNDPQYRTPDGSALRLWRTTAPNPYQSQSHGRPIFDEVIMLEVISPGSKGSTPVFEVERVFSSEANHPEPLRGMQYDQYRDFIERFKSHEVAEASMTGTPLSEWPAISRTMAASLREANIYSVEALAALPDSQLHMVGPDGRTWRTQAEAYLKAATDASFAPAVAAENERLRAELAEAREQLAQLSVLASAAAEDVQAEPEAAPAPATSRKRTAAPADTVPAGDTVPTGDAVPAGDTGLQPII